MQIFGRKLLDFVVLSEFQVVEVDAAHGQLLHVQHPRRVGRHGGQHVPGSDGLRNLLDRVLLRGGLGVRTYRVTEKTGRLIGAKKIFGDEDILLVSDDGTVIRMPADSISRQAGPPRASG